MKISRFDALDLFDHYGFIDLRDKKYYPSMKLSKLKKLNNNISQADYSKMEQEKDRYVSPPVRNPMYIDFVAALRSGVTHSKLIDLGYHESDASQEFLSPEEGMLLREQGPSRAASDAMHALRNYLFEINSYSSFLSNWEAVRMNTIKNWLFQYGIEIE